SVRASRACVYSTGESLRALISVDASASVRSWSGASAMGVCLGAEMGRDLAPATTLTRQRGGRKFRTSRSSPPYPLHIGRCLSAIGLPPVGLWWAVRTWRSAQAPISSKKTTLLRLALSHLGSVHPDLPCARIATRCSIVGRRISLLLTPFCLIPYRSPDGSHLGMKKGMR